MKFSYFKSAFITLLLLTFALAGCSAPEIDGASEQQVYTSPYDTREYRTLILDNGIKVMLVSDPETEKSAAALAVGAGSMQNPDEQLGLAHFLEHMLFLGTEKYPDPDEYSEFMSRHSGMHNAYTADDHTNYMFEINNGALPEALDRFADFFKAPLFTPEYVEKEVNAVNSEWSMQRANDGFVMFALNNITLNPEHPIARFRIGNNESLGDKENSKLLDAMLAFYQRYYSANLMTVAVAGNRSLDELEQLARDSFSDIPNFNAKVDEITVPPATADELQQIIYYQPQVETRDLLFDFMIPNMDAAFRSKPAAIVSYIIASEMPGTPAALLREAGFIESMSSWGETSNYGNAGRLRVYVSLTEQGYAQKELVMGLLFRYFDEIRAEGVDPAYIDEVRTVLNNDFQFLRRQGAFDYVASLSAVMQNVPMQHVVDADYRLDSFDAEATQQVLDALTPANVRIFVIAPEVETDQEMHFFAGKYRVEKLSDATLAEWKNMAGPVPISLPAVNRLLPEDLSLVAGDALTTEPKTLLNENGVSLLYQRSERFAEPRAVVTINYNKQLSELTAEQRLSARILLDSFNLSEQGLAREASIAGVNFNLGINQGLELSLSGFNDKQVQLAEMVMDRFIAFSPTAEQFEQARDRFRRGIENQRRERPLQRLFPAYSAMIAADYKTEKERLALLQSMTMEQVVASREALLNDVLVRALVYGNYSETAATELTKKLGRYATANAARTFSEYDKVRNLSDYPLSYQNDTELSDSAVLDGYLVNEESMKLDIAYSMLRDLMHTRFFNQLRTEEQLGYAVGVTSLRLQGKPGLAFYIQSPVRGPDDLITRFESFKADFQLYLANLSDERFAEVQASVRSDLVQPAQSLNEEAGQVRSEWRKEKPMFDRREQQLSLVENMTKIDLVNVYNRLVGEEALRVRVEFRGSDFADTEFSATEGWTMFAN
ncbi:MAG TPA: pitrilysin [Aliidiomarina sp.]|nr:pitrilysin [Aliidiomarina sp.]